MQKPISSMSSAEFAKFIASDADDICDSRKTAHMPESETLVYDYLKKSVYLPDNPPVVQNVVKPSVEEINTTQNTAAILHQYQQAELGINVEDGSKPFNTDDDALDEQSGTVGVDTPGTHGILTSVGNLLNLHTENNIKNLFNPQSRYVKSYIPINNQNRHNTQLADGTFRTSWNLTYGIPGVRTGYIDVNFTTRDIVAMRMKSLTITCRSTFMQNQISRNRTAVLIEELAPQSFVSTEGNNFHFIGYQSVSSQYPSVSIKTVSFYYFNRGNYRFRMPITKLDSLTLSLYNPFQPLPLDPENISGVVVQGTNPAQLTFNLEHGLYQDYITISGYTTGDPVTDAALIASVNTTFTYPGFTVVDLYTITIPIDVSGATPLASNPVINGYRPVDMNGALEIISLRPSDDQLDG